MDHRLPLVALLAIAAPAADEISLDLRDWPVRIGREAQLFVDDHLLARRSGLEIRVHQPEKHPSNPLIVPRPPETLTLAYGSVLREAPGRFRLWYTNNIGIAYAESADGVAWTRPPENQLTRGHRGRSDTLTVFLSPHPPFLFLAYAMEYRFPDKDGVRETSREGIYLRTSPDGLRWTERPDPVMYSEWRNKQDQDPASNAHLGDVHHIAWDPKLEKFMGHVKLTKDTIRMRGLAESDDGIYWSTPRLILRADEQDLPGDQLYSMIAFPYESMWLAFLGLYHKGTTERMDIQLASSRDGRNWSRPHRATFLSNGPQGTFDWGVMHMAANPPLRVGDSLYIYYDGIGSAHNVRLRDVKTQGIGLATLRPDGFVSLDAAATPGLLVTRPLRFEGERLHLNAIIRSAGSIRVRPLDAAYKPLAEWSAPISGDGLNLPIACDLSKAKGSETRLQFEIVNASLYSFRLQ
jgi:hypothetical protein